MNDRTQASLHDPRRNEASAQTSEPPRSERDEWMHEFRNALGNILIAANAARGLLTDQRNADIETAMGHIEDGCERCLRLLRTMPP